MTKRRRALLFATDLYQGAPPLRYCVKDAHDLQATLADPAVGAFSDVELIADPQVDTFRDAASSFLAKCGLDDVVLIHIGGHMALDNARDLRIITSDTDATNLYGTTVSGAWLIDQLNDARAKRVVLILDGCHSGSIRAINSDLNDFDAANAAGLAGRGRVVIASATPDGPAYEQYSPEKPRSFTDILVRGIRSGAADVDQDGLITAFELFEYGYNETVKHFPDGQRPTMRMFGGTPASITVAYNPSRRAIGATAHGTIGLPFLLRKEISSDQERVRARAMWRLFELVDSDEDATRTQALLALFEMSQDPNDQIRRSVHWRLTAGEEWWTEGESGRDLVRRLEPDTLVDWQQVVKAIQASTTKEVKVMGDLNIQNAGGDIKGSAAGRKNTITYAEASVDTPQTMRELKEAIEALANEVDTSALPIREKAIALPALIWWAENIDSDTEPAEAKQQASALRRAGGWIWERFADLVDAMPAAVVAAWAVEVLKHVTH